MPENTTAMGNSPDEEKLLTSIGARLAAIRYERGEVIKQVTAATGLSGKVISQLENGRYRPIKLLDLRKLAAYLQIPLAELVNTA